MSEQEHSQEPYQPSERARQDFGIGKFGWIAANLYKHCNRRLDDDGLGVAGDIAEDYRLDSTQSQVFRRGRRAYIRAWQEPRYHTQGAQRAEADACVLASSDAPPWLQQRANNLDAWVTEARSEQDRWEREGYREAFQAALAKWAPIFHRPLPPDVPAATEDITEARTVLQKARFVCEINVVDPDSHGEVPLAVYKTVGGALRIKNGTGEIAAANLSR